ncbi:MAG: tRNA uridine(34) 5-carboxymethylaminomethyl modification radical SAM/GNAT enzyme Elp3 [Candidatus Pacebacteria bacterium]|nr:tRNA uridine(34) 5-carboxymethylaminomethyl modification radical SAM/GNAT enzyme Elp3 [Candidatus Paceibacterota bacterium]
MNQKELIIKKLIEIKAKTPNDLSFSKRMVGGSYPTNIDLLKAYHTLVKKKSIKENKNIENLLKTRPVRSLSGVINVSVLTKPYECPGKCIFCPKEINIPKSYLSGEPAVERAKRLNFDPYIQVKKRIEVLEMSGHASQKIDLRLIGGTWSYYDTKYKIWFVKKCFDACNNSRNKNDDDLSIKELWQELEKAQKKNEKSKHRIVGMSFETRPDFIDIKEILEMKKLGATKIELGVQTIYDDILKLNKRGHYIKETINSTELLKNAGFKVAYQLMLNLPGSTPQKDIKMFKEVFKNENFKPDYLKIYPCALVKEAPIYKLYLQKKYKPYSKKILIKTIKEIKKIIPRYVRIERIIRDIPANLIVEGGAKMSNLRQIIEKDMAQENWQCQCIRCREIKDLKQNKKLYLFRENYKASKGNEIFLSFEDKERKNIYSLLRLRINSKNVIPVLKNSTVVRELHTYGQAVLLKDSSVQHKGLGKKLLKEAEKITKEEYNINKISVISGVGVRKYYKKLGYKLKEGYMIKNLITTYKQA